MDELKKSKKSFSGSEAENPFESKVNHEESDENIFASRYQPKNKDNPFASSVNYENE